jgi:hypothetical protein
LVENVTLGERVTYEHVGEVVVEAFLALRVVICRVEIVLMRVTGEEIIEHGEVPPPEVNVDYHAGGSLWLLRRGGGWT